MVRMTSVALAAFALFGVAHVAQAHQIWIEQPVGQKTAVVRFGEHGENLREASPGLLDEFGKLTATLLSADGGQNADARKTPSGFALPFGAVQGDKETRKRYYPAARLITTLAAQQPELVFDLVPSGNAGEFRLFFKGQPKTKTKVVLVTPSGWAKEGHTDEQGLVKIDGVAPIPARPAAAPDK